MNRFDSNRNEYANLMSWARWLVDRNLWPVVYAIFIICLPVGGLAVLVISVVQVLHKEGIGLISEVGNTWVSLRQAAQYVKDRNKKEST